MKHAERLGREIHIRLPGRRAHPAGHGKNPKGLDAQAQMGLLSAHGRYTNRWLVVSNMAGLFSISYMGCHPSH